MNTWTRSVAALAGTCMAVVVAAQGPAEAPAQLTGVWRGTSTCTDHVAAPACNDEAVVYEFAPGTRAGTVRWSADRISDGQRVHMGEFDLTYDSGEACWKVEFTTPRFKGVWRLSIDGSRMSGTLRLLPGNETVRSVELRKN